MFKSFHTPSDPRWAGTQYRSAIFYMNEEQKKLAELAVKGMGAMGDYVAVEPASDFYRGEEYHQNYLDKMML
jgi:peptide methionine sulfoxide reductase MsrA